MSASPAFTTSDNGSTYHALRADFEAAYRKMTDLSREFNAVLMTVPGGLSPEERQARKERAAQAYEAAHERFLSAVGTLHEYMLSQIIASRCGLQPNIARGQQR